MKKLLTVTLLFISIKIISQSNITWNMGMNIATSASGNDHPRITTDRAGNPLVIWHNASRVMFSRWNGSAFTTPTMLNPMNITVAGASWMGPDIASKGDTIYVVYKQTPEAYDTSHIYCIRSFNGGNSFSAPVQVDNIADSISRFPTVTVDAIGNPIIGFMKFDAAFGDARWVVTTSTNFGTTFSSDVKASGWSSATSTVCDCCPGSIVCSANNVAMLYRDNNSNIRDMWAGISTNSGNTFTQGFTYDNNNWMQMTCVSSGPDATIIGDTLYTTYMSGVTGDDLVYFNKSSLSSITDTTGIPLTGNITGLSAQNYPRINSNGNALAIVWKQTVNSTDYLSLRFTNNVYVSSTFENDTVDMSNITNADVALSNNKIYVVWEDDGSGTVKFRSGTYTASIAINETNDVSNQFSFYPNPANNQLQVTSYKFKVEEIKIVNLLGESVFQSKIINPQSEVSLDISGLSNGIYFIQINNGTLFARQKFIKQ